MGDGWIVGDGKRWNMGHVLAMQRLEREERELHEKVSSEEMRQVLRQAFYGRQHAYSEMHLADILEIWKPALTGELEHQGETLRLPINGGAVHITPSRIIFQTEGNASPSPEAIHASIQHIATFWGGKALIDKVDRPHNATRLMLHAYAQVYGVELHDKNGALTSQQQARLPALLQQIRARHPDAPPARPANRNAQGQPEQRPAA